MLANETVQNKINDQLSPSKGVKKEMIQPTSSGREQPPIPPPEERMREVDYRPMPYNDHYSSYEYRDRYRSYSGSRRPLSPYMSRHSSSRGRDRSYSPRRHRRSSYSREDSRRRSRRRSFSRSPIRRRSHSRGGYYRHPYHPSMDRGRYEREYTRPRKARYIERGTEEDRKTTCNIFIGNLPYSYTESDIADMFEQYGRLKRITVPLDNRTHNNKGFAFVEFENRRDAEDAYDKYRGRTLGGRAIRIDWDVGKEKKFNNAERRNNSRSRSREPSYR